MHFCPKWPNVSSHLRNVVIAGRTPQVSGNILDLGFLKVIDTDYSWGCWLMALEVRTAEVIHSSESAIARTKGRVKNRAYGLSE